MDNINTTSTKTFYEFYDNLTDGSKKKILNDYIYTAEQSFGTFYNKKRNKSFSRLEKILIERICGQEFKW